MISFCNILKSEPSFYGDLEYYYLEDLLYVLSNNLDLVEEMIEMVVITPDSMIS